MPEEGSLCDRERGLGHAKAAGTQWTWLMRIALDAPISKNEVEKVKFDGQDFSDSESSEDAEVIEISD